MKQKIQIIGIQVSLIISLVQQIIGIIYIKLNNKGFTFIEVLISLFIVSLVSMEFCMIVNMNNIWNPKNKKDIHAMDILKNETEHLTKEIKVKKLNYNKMVHIIHLNIVKYEI